MHSRRTGGTLVLMILLGSLTHALHDATAARAEPVIEVLAPSQSPEEAHTRARAHVQIVMYTAKWCGACTAARNYLHKHRLAFGEHDVERDVAARARFRALNPAGTLPTIELDGLVMQGFGARAFEALLEQATQERVARHDGDGPKTFEVHWDRNKR